MDVTPHVISLYCGALAEDFAKARIAGVVGVVHKASRGTDYADGMYDLTRPKVREQGLEWGAYHVLSNEDPVKQARHFLSCAKPSARTLIAVEFVEYSDPAASPELHHLLAFLQAVETATAGRRAVIYAGNALKAALAAIPYYSRDLFDNFLSGHRLWLVDHGRACWSLSPLTAWRWPWLWQYTCRGESVPGILGDCGKIHCSFYDGRPRDLRREWADNAVPFSRVEQPVARQVHTLEIASSNLAPATTIAEVPA